MPDLHSPVIWAMALSAALCIGLAKAGFGGLGIVSVSLFAQLFPAKESTGALLPIMIAGDCLGVYFYRRHANWKDLGKLLPTTLAGIICGWLIMPYIPDQRFTVFLGWLILGLMALTIIQRRFPQLLLAAMNHPLLGLAAGWTMGVTTMLANAAGAITSFYLLGRRMDKLTMVGTAAWFFLIVNLAKVPFSAQLGLISPASLKFDLLLIPGVVVGALSGRLVLQRVPQQIFEHITIALAVAAALRLILAG